MWLWINWEICHEMNFTVKLFAKGVVLMEKSHHKTKFMKLNTATWFASDLTENFVKMNPATLLNLHLIWRENSWNWILQLAFSSDLTANFVKMNFTLTLFWQKFRESNVFTKYKEITQKLSNFFIFPHLAQQIIFLIVFVFFLQNLSLWKHNKTMDHGAT